MKKYIIGITGGIGSGKSTVSEILRNKNYFVIDADTIAKELLNNTEILKEIKKEFPQAFVENVFNKKILSDIVFNSKSKLNKLNSIIHPEVAKEIIQLINDSDDKLIFIDVPIPTKECFTDIVDEIWVVSTDKDIRINRIMERSNWSLSTTTSRIVSQLSEEEYLALSNIIINNNGTKKELEDKVNYLLQIPR